MSESIFQQLSALLPAGCVRENVTLAPYTTMRTGGPAALFAEPRNAQQLAHVHQWAQEKGLSLLILGNGSNLLIADSGFDGLVIHLGRALSEVSVFANTLTAQAGASLAAAARAAAQASLTGLEFAAGIPGSIGGAVCMNAGAYGSELKDVLAEVEYIDPKKGVCGRRAIAEGDFEYRSSIFAKNGWIVTGARFRLRRGAAETERALFEEYQQQRREKQPLNLPSAGSVFKRPSGHFAGALIEQAGLKGAAVGGAQVSKLHAGFIVNTGGATAADVLALIERIKKDVRQAFGVSLEEELKVIGE